MTQELKQEALEQMNLDIKFGFLSEPELFESLCDMFYDEPDLDKDWLRTQVTEHYQIRQEESKSWPSPTDFDRLDKSFEALAQKSIVCLHNAGYTRQDGEGDSQQAIEKLNQVGINIKGFCYYHSQDLARVVDPQQKDLFLGFDSLAHDEEQTIEIANTIISILAENKFSVTWSGSVEERIEIKNVNWQKVPDLDGWGIERAVRTARKYSKLPKPFWKFWK
jgi:hypothetical protein